MDNEADQIAAPELPMVNPLDWNGLLDLCGEKALTYLLNQDTAVEPTADDQVRASAIATLGQVAGVGADREQRLAAISGVLGAPVGETSWGTAVRAAVSAPALLAPSEETPEAVFAWIIEDLFSALLVDAYNGAGFLIHAKVGQHPATVRMFNAMVADATLTKLYPGAQPVVEPKDLVHVVVDTVSAHSGGTKQPPILVGALGLYTIIKMQLDGRLDAFSISEYASRSIADLRTLASGRALRVPCVFDLNGISIEGVARLRNLGILPGASLAIQAIGPLVEDRTVGMVSVTEQIYEVVPRAVDGTPGGDDDLGPYHAAWQRHSPKIQSALQNVVKEIDRVRLAIVLASHSEGGVAKPVSSDWTVVSPLSVRGFFPRSQTSTQGERVSVTASALETSLGLCAELPSKMWLSGRRILKAVIERPDPVDAFIDAVIAWEGLLGTAGETNLRLSAGIALLLHPDSPYERAILYDRVKDAYRKRNNVVHGGGELTVGESAGLRDMAIDIAIRSVAAILARPDLRDADNAARSRMLLLGA